jgi:hypothetical protein
MVDVLRLMVVGRARKDPENFSGDFPGHSRRRHISAAWA